jgi:pyrroline-5-carboxylate reductase
MIGRYGRTVQRMSDSLTVFIGGGNMATALVGGLLRAGTPRERVLVLDPSAAQRERLAAELGVATAADAAAAGERLARATRVVWAVKPQSFRDAAVPLAAAGGAAWREALHLSVMAGVRLGAIARALGVEASAARLVRSMPNTPALIGRGIAGLYAGAGVTPADRAAVEALLAPTGRTLWVAREADLDAVTALSGSGPAYVFYFVEAMMAAAERLGLPPEQGRDLALATFDGATALALQSTEPPAVLRERVTSRGGTTFAALESMRADGIAEAIGRAVEQARRRAAELGDEFG